MTEPIGIDSGLTEAQMEAQMEAARLLAVGCRAVNVAEEVGVDESTISRWRRKAPFAALVQAMHAEANMEVLGRMTELTNKSLDVLEDMLTYKHDPSLKLRAAIAIVNVSGITRMMKATAQTEAGDDSAAS